MNKLKSQVLIATVESRKWRNEKASDFSTDQQAYIPLQDRPHQDYYKNKFAIHRCNKQLHM